LPGGLTGSGVILFVICVLLAGSGVERYREVLSAITQSRAIGMSAHPYLILVGLVFPFIVMQRIAIVPLPLITSFAVFSALWYVSTFYGGIAVQELFKISATFLTIVVAALLIRTREDFLAGVAGLCLGVGIIAVTGLRTAGVGGDIISGTGRNTFSLYALPMMLLGGYVITQFRGTSPFLTMTILASIAASMIAMTLTLNRSGWLGAGVIALLLLPGGKLRSLSVIATVGAAVLLFLRDPVEIQAVGARVRQTAEGNQSDDLRMQLLEASLHITLEAPLLGVSPQNLPMELAARLGHPGSFIAPHNVVAQVSAGSGIPCFIALVWIGAWLWRWRISPKSHPAIAQRFRAARGLLRMMLMLWVIRGMFSHEILYAPAFSIGIGICIGMCLRYTSIEPRRTAVVGRGRQPETARRRRRLRVSPALEL
jgi:hypothetical protein